MALDKGKLLGTYGGKIHISAYDVLSQEGFVQEILKSLKDPQKLSLLQKEEKTLDVMLLTLQRLWSNYRTLQEKKSEGFLGNQGRAYGVLNEWTRNYQPGVALEFSGSKLQEEIMMEEISNLILDLYHQIQKMLSLLNPKSETTEYAIYFTGANGQTLRGSISSEDLYNTDYISVSQNGAIQLSKQITEFLQTSKNDKGQQRAQPVNWDVYDQIIKVAIREINEIKIKKIALEKIASGEHLYDERDNQLDAAYAVGFSENAILAMYAKYANIAISELSKEITVQDQEKKWSQIFAAINRGHIAEAYERYWQSDFSSEKINEKILQDFLAESLGNDPWYSQGDVGSTQVKSFFDNSDRRQIASLSSIITVATSISKIMKIGIEEYVAGGPYGSQKQLAAIERKTRQRKKEIDAMGDIEANEVLINAINTVFSETLLKM